MEDTAALLGSSAIKQRLAGVTGLLEQLRRQDAAPEASATLIPHVLPCLRDHNSKIALGALEILQLLVSRVAESTLRSYFKLLWLSLVERLGDSKLPVREKAVDVVVEISVVLDVGTVLDKLKACMGHKNWRTRGQSLHAVWRCLERHELFKEKQDELLDDVLKLLEDSSKDVRDAAITALEKFYMYIGASLLSDLEYKNIRSAQVKTLTDRFERIPVRSKESRAVTRTAPSNDDRSNQDYDDDAAQDNGAPEKYSSILSSYDLQVSSSSSSVARYLASVRSRTINEAKAMADGPGDGDRSPSQASSTSSKVVQDFSAAGTLGSGGGDISEKEIQKQLGVVFDKLHLDNNWDKRVDGLKMLQKLAKRCGSASNSGAILPFLSQGLRPIRERLCQQVSDLRSSVSREACQTIQTLAGYLRDEFNAHAEICLGNLLKATYVTIQVISTSADTTIRSMIESTSNGYARVIPKLIECAKSRNQVLRYNAVCYLTLTLQRWSTSFLSKHSDMFVPILPAILQDALGDVRAQSRKCYWAFHHLFPDEANGVFARLDGTTQKNLKDDPSKIAAKTARKTEFISMDAPAPQTVEVGRSVLRSANAVQPSSNAPVASSSVTFSDEQPSVVRVTSSGDLVSEKLPRRVLGGNSGLAGDDTAQENLQPSRMLSQGPMRVGRVKTPVSKEKSTSSNDRKKGAPAGPLRVWNAPPKPSQTPSTAMESLYASRQEPSTASFHTSSKNPTSKAQRVQRAAEAQAPVPMDIDDAEPSGPKRLPVASMPSPTASNASSSRTNNSSRGDPVDVKSKPARTVPAKPSERPKVAQLPVADELEEALRNIESRSWSTRLEAAEYIGKILQRRLDQIDSGARGDYKLDGRILTIFIKHLSDAHYRVSQGVLKYFLPLLKLSNDSQRLLPHLKTVLPKLFQKYIDTKESIRVIAKENLEYIASAIDSSTLAALVISMLGDGSNMKVKAAMCHYLRDLLPGAGEYLKHGANNSHMRSFLLKIALLMDTDVPVSVSSACGELVSIAAQLYGPEIEVALGLLPPSKRLVVSKVLKSKKIVLNFSRPPLSSSAAPHSARSRDGGDDDNQDMELPVPKPERSRKRPESPSVSSSSPARPSSQKRINTAVQIHAAVAAESERTGDRPSRPAPAKQHDEKMTGKTALSGHPVLSQVAFSSAAATVDNYDVQLDDLLLLLEQNNLSEAEIKHTLYKTLHFIETESSATWDRCFGRLLLLLLDAATDQDVHALKVLQKLVEAQPSRAQMFFELLLQRLIDAIGDQVDVARHLMERILHDLVSFASDHQQTLSTLMPLVPRVDPPALQVVLRLVKVCLQACERRSAHDAAFLRQPDVANSFMGALTRRLDHASSSVRKNAVDCLVAFHFATKEDSAIVPKYLAAELDDTRRRLVEIFIDRAKVERHPVGLST